MAGQEQQRHARKDDGEPDDAAPPPQGAPATQTKDDDVDAILDEIDGVLEANSETFVRGFVQKGGE